MRVTPWPELRIEADGGRIAGLKADREQARSPLAAIERWDIDALLGREVTAAAPATFDEMLPLWVGKAALREAAPERIAAYRDFLGPYGLAERFMAILDDAARDRGRLLECDLGPAHDFLLLEQQLERLPGDGPLVILEAGGGYGPLAELLVRHARRRCCVVLADGIAESVFYSWAYLRARLPGARIGAAFMGDAFRPAEQDVLVVPSWQLPGQVDGIDVLVNIASLQEMPDEAAAAWLAFGTRQLRPGGLVFLENSRDQFYRREYLYPPAWRYLVKRVSPRSRSLDYPLDILQATASDQSAANKPVVEAYYVEMKERAAAQLRAQAETLQRQAREMAGLRAAATARAATATALRHRLAAVRRDQAQALAGLRDRHRAQLDELRRKLAAAITLRRVVEGKLAALRRRHAEVVAGFRARLLAVRPRPAADRPATDRPETGRSPGS